MYNENMFWAAKHIMSHVIIDIYKYKFIFIFINFFKRCKFYNYVDWIKYGTKTTDEWDNHIKIKDKPRSNIKKVWLKYLENFNADIMYGSFING